MWTTNHEKCDVKKAVDKKAQKANEPKDSGQRSNLVCGLNLKGVNKERKQL